MPNFLSRPVDTKEALAVAKVLYDRNGGKVILDNNIEGLPSTKTQLINHFNKKDVVGQLDLNCAEELRKSIEHEIVVSALTNKLVSDFIYKVSDLIKHDSIPLRLIALVGWAPHLVAQIIKKNSALETLGRYQFISRHMGRPGEKLQLNVNIVEKRYIKHFDSYRYKGYTDTDNVVLFYAKKDFSNTISITAKVKNHLDENGTKLTNLNYVKLLK